MNIIVNSFAITNSTEEAIDLIANDTETAEGEFANETNQAETESAEGVLELCNNLLEQDFNNKTDKSNCIKSELG
ncbi:MAG: hypothetical protein R3321_04725 [Nitrososphaeraceae archaeon]|nr:hypothetical protein [Nitrososphaeraceae archaeon]